MDREKVLLIITGVIVGGLAVLLVAMGNPGNMGFCIACFLRDTAGGLGFHRVNTVQYIRPELIGLVIGAFIAAIFNKEFKSRGGSSTLVRFLLGIFMMLGALIFLGCPLRDILRIGGGDLNAVVGLAGLIVGILWGVFFLKRGFNLGAAKSEKTRQAGGYIFILFAVGLLILLMVGFNFNPAGGGPLFFSTTGPGSMHAPLWISLGAGLLVGFLSQRARLCLTGGFRDFFLIGYKGMLIAYAAILVTVFSANMYLGNFHIGFINQPIAHTDHIFNFLGLFLVGLCGVLLGGCPLRQMILSSEGDMDAGVTVAGMIAGAAIAHNFMIAATTKGTTSISQIALIAGIIIVSAIGWTYCEGDA